MPISEFQSTVLNVIAAARDPDSFIAGGLPLNRSGPRFSKDIDIFRREPGIQAALITREEESTRLEWLVDSDYRFFPAVKDPEFVTVLHVVDLAVNKIMAAASRCEPRDLVDLVRFHQAHLPLGAIAWAAVTVAPGFTPEGLLAEVRRNARYTADDFRRLDSDSEIDGAMVMTDLRAALDEAEDFISKMPTDEAGAIYLEDGKPVMPDPAKLDSYIRHRPQRRGHWPTATQITAAMLDSLQRSVP